MRKLGVIVIVAFCCTVSYAQKGKSVRENHRENQVERTSYPDMHKHKGGESSCRISVAKSGGKPIRKGLHKDEIGYYSVNQRISLKENGSYEIVVSAMGKGLNICPEVYKVGNRSGTGTLNADVYNLIVAKVQKQIDAGKASGHFAEDNFCCYWSKGEKSIDEENIAYSYVLIMKDENTIVIDDQREK